MSLIHAEYQYECGCKAIFHQPQGPLPDYCPVHGKEPSSQCDVHAAMQQQQVAQILNAGYKSAQPQGFGETPQAPSLGGKSTALKPEVWTGVIESFPRAIEKLAIATMEGAKQPGHFLHGWKLVPDGYRLYSEAMARHLLKESSPGHERLLECTAVAWNAMARLEHLLKQREESGL